jgi:hypothetical protein
MVRMERTVALVGPVATPMEFVARPLVPVVVRNHLDAMPHPAPAASNPDAHGPWETVSHPAAKLPTWLALTLTVAIQWKRFALSPRGMRRIWPRAVAKPTVVRAHPL